MDDRSFWALIANLDWSKTGDDDAVVEPVVRALSGMSEATISAFLETLATKLYAIDGRAWARRSGAWWGEPDSLSVDEFLYERCAVVANGRDYFEAVLRDPARMPNDVEFESLLYVADKAFERKTGREWDRTTRVSWETFSNSDGWT